MRPRLKNPIKLVTWIWQSYLKTAIIPLVAVELTFLIIFFMCNSWVTSEMSKNSLADAYTRLREISVLETDAINKELRSIHASTVLFASQMAETLKEPSSLSPMYASSLKYSPDGVYYTSYNVGGPAAYFSGIVPVGDAQRQKVARVLAAEVLMRNLYRSNRLIVSVYINTFDSLNVIYPYIDVYAQYSPFIDLQAYNFYYEADAKHNPSRTGKWTDVYLDPAGHGWLVSSIAPVYNGDFLEGVVGMDVTVGNITEQILDMNIPWDGYGMLVGNDGTILALPEKGEKDWGLDELIASTYQEVIMQDTFKPESYNIFKRSDLKEFADAVSSSSSGLQTVKIGDEDKVVTWNLIHETGWKLVSIAPEKNIFAKIDGISSSVRMIGLIIICAVFTFYIAFIHFLFKRSRKFSKNISAPLMEMNNIAKKIGEGDFYQVAHDFHVNEFRETLDNLVEMGRRLGLANEELLATHEMLAQQETYLQAVLDSTDDFVLEFGRDGKIFKIISSNMAEYVKNNRQDNIIAEQFLAPTMAEHFKNVINKVIETGEPAACDYELKVPVGIRWVVVRMTRIQNGVPRAIVSVRDITERKEMEESILKARDEAEAASRAKTQFLSSMSHELRTPLNAVLGFAQVLEMDTSAALTAMQRECVGEIIKAGTHLLELINDVLDLAKIEAGKASLLIETVEISSIMWEAYAIIAPIADKYGVKVSLTETCADKFVRADKIKLKQILINLLSNAVKYNKTNGEIRYYCEEIGDKIRFHVVDTGIGFSSEYVDLIFTPFYRLINKGKIVEGAGVGLAVVKQLTEMMDGEIVVESKVGEGSHFYVELAAVEKPDDWTALGLDEKQPNVAAQVDGLKKILYIEDNAANLKLVERILKQRGNITFLSAVTAENGIKIALEEKPDIILMDINLPGIDGFEAFEKLQKYTSTWSIPVIAVSANAMERDISRAKVAGFADYITKPFNPEEFFERLNIFL